MPSHVPPPQIYARVSTTDKGQDVQNQLLELSRFAASQGWDIIEPVYQDHASGSKGRNKRPLFDRMLTDAAKRRFDILLVWSADRLSRQGPYETLDVVKRLSTYGVRFRSLQQPFLDTTNGFGEVLLALFGWLASEERRLISERTKAGLKRATSQGKVLGRRPVKLIWRQSIRWGPMEPVCGRSPRRPASVSARFTACWHVQ